MGRAKHGRCLRGTRPAVGSAGRPGINLRNEQRCFRLAIAKGCSSEAAAIEAYFSPPKIVSNTFPITFTPRRIVEVSNAEMPMTKPGTVVWVIR